MDAYRIVIPSRKRTKLVQRVRTLLPTATVTVEASEMEDYAPFVPPDLLVPHPPLGGIAAIRNWILDSFPEPCIIMSDDDFNMVMVLGGVMRRLKNPEDIRRLIENQVTIATDLNIGIFNWNPGMPMVRNYNAQDPFSFTKDVWGVFGLRGESRTSRRFDLKADGLEDIDMTLQALRDDRIVLTDLRFHFDVGVNQTTQGGNLRADTAEQRVRATDHLRNKWGPELIPLRPTGLETKRRGAVPRRQ